MGDLISRQWLMEFVNEGWIKFDTEKDKNIFIHLVRDFAPSALPKTKWIPVSRKLPKNDDFVIVSIKDTCGDTSFVYSDFGWYFNRADCWIVDAQERTDVIAWMPLPEPYKAESEEQA